MTNHNYSKQHLYDSRIKPLVKKILLICDEYHLPMFMTFAVKNDDKDTSYISEMYSAAACDTILTNDRLVKHALVMNDFEVVPAEHKLLYDEDPDDLEVIEDDKITL